MDNQRSLRRLERKSDIAERELMKARRKLPVRRRLKIVKKFDPEHGGMKRRLRVQKAVRPRSSKTIKGRVAGLAGKGVGMAVDYGHQKIREVERENVGVEAAHKIEQVAENLTVKGVRALGRYAVDTPYRRVRKAEKKVINAGSKYQYRKTVYDNPALQKQAVRRARVKRQIRKRYAASVRPSRSTAQKVGQAAARAGKGLARFVARVIGPKRKVMVYLTIGILLFLLISSCVTVAGTFTAGIFGTVAEHTYAADDVNIEGSSLEWTQWEYELQKEIDNAESNYPGYANYEYELEDSIGHNPYQIIAFLSALYDDFLYTDVSDALRAVFEEVYQLEFIPDGDTLIISLIVQDFNDVVKPLLEEADALEQYEAYMKSLGGHQRYGNPLGFAWYGSITSLYGYRDNPFGEKDKTEVHRGLDIAAAEGHPIYSVHDGLVVQAVHGDSIYGNYLVVEDADGRKVKYAHCSALLVKLGDAVEKGDVIAQVGTTGRSTGPHLHCEIIENGVWMNPLFLLEST